MGFEAVRIGPTQLDELYTQSIEKADGMPHQFFLMYEDSDFNNSLVSLDNMQQLHDCLSVSVVQIGEDPVEVAASSCAALCSVASWPHPLLFQNLTYMSSCSCSKPKKGFRFRGSLKETFCTSWQSTYTPSRRTPQEQKLSRLQRL